MSALPAPALADESIEADLDFAMLASETQDELYRPSAFWKQAARDIAERLRLDGFERFRRHPVPLAYFVQTYGVPGNTFDAETCAALRDVVAGDAKRSLTLDRFLSGEENALADYRVLRAADDGRWPCLGTFSESAVGDPIERFVFDGRTFSRSSLAYLHGLCLLARHVGPESIRTVLEIGGGFGSLGEIVASGEDAATRYIGLDIPPNSTITQYYLGEVFGPNRVATHRRTADLETLDIARLPPISALANWQIENLRGDVDLFVNFVSFQEMEPAIVRNYLAHVTRLNTRWILLRNLREGKQVQTATSVGVAQPIVSDDYLEMLPGYELVERNVLPFGQKKVDGYHSELLLLGRRDVGV